MILNGYPESNVYTMYNVLVQCCTNSINKFSMRFSFKRAIRLEAINILEKKVKMIKNKKLSV